MSDSKRLLVLDEKKSPYETFFGITGWEQVVLPTPQQDENLTPEMVMPVLAEPYDAILIDFDWLKQYAKEILASIIQTKRPFIIIARGNPSDGYKWAMVQGASGYIPEEAFAPETAKEEILAILQCFALSASDQSQLSSSANDGEEIITYLLRQRSVCFPHWAVFFGKNADAVFEADALNALYSCPSGNLKDAVRSAVWSAHLDSAPKVQKKHLGRRFQLLFENQMTLDWEDEGPAREYLKSVNDDLLWYGSITEIAKKKGPTEDKLKERLRILRKKHPNIDFKVRFTNIYFAFPIKFMLVYHSQSSAESDTVMRHLKPLEHSFYLTIDHNHKFLPGDEVAKVIGQFVESADLFILLLCPDFFATDEIVKEILPAIYQKKETGKVEITPVILKDCSWEEHPQISEMWVLPRSKSPVMEGTIGSNTVLKEIVKEIRTLVLEKIWAA